MSTALLETRTLTVLLATAAARARPALLRDFVRRFHAGDPVSLVLHAPAHDAEHELALLTPQLEPLLLDRPEAPDVVVFAVPDGAATELEESAFALLEDATALRALVDERMVAERSRDEIVLGTGSYRGAGSHLRTFAPGEQIVVGSYTSIAENVTVLAGGGHRTDTVSTFPFDPCLLGTRFPDGWLDNPGVNRSYVTSQATEIGSDVWIGHGALVSAGVHVGHGAVIASGAVVFRDVPPYAVVAGNPAKPVRYRFSKDVVERLVRIRWWDWPDDVVRAHVDWFYRPIAEFLDRFDPIPAEEET
jgi:acetyltransferase-like isoleucine patch superfamily enzyme